MTTVFMSVNESAPDFELASTGGTIRLSDARGLHPVVLYVMRAFSCPICQGHVRALNKLTPTLPDTQVLILGGGSLLQAQHLASRLHLTVPVLADPTGEVLERYTFAKLLDVWQRSGTVVIDRQGQTRMLQASFNPANGFAARDVVECVRTLDSA
ncbi:peroxiredoxin family protein [Deinococcus oregonensis]|uniref:Peroxiredoxin family protein n=1 Tax=Deinococcus oregonensis TaxID=1805970 RepID=A0ABV6AYT7_9DEIO